MTGEGAFKNLRLLPQIWLLYSAGSSLFSVSRVPELHLISQAKRHGSQLAHALAHGEAPEVGHQLLPLVVCKQNVGNDQIICCTRGCCEFAAANADARCREQEGSFKQKGIVLLCLERPVA